MNWLEILGSVINALLPYIITAFSGFVAWLGMQLKNKYNEKVKNETIRTVIADAVNYVEQKFKGYASEEKYQLAVDKIESILNSKGIKITDDEIEILIESSVLTLTGSIKKEGE